MSWRRRTALVLLAGTVGLGLLAFGFFPQEPLRALLERRLAAALGGKARIGRLHVVPADLTAELEEVAFEAPGWRFEARRIRVRAGAEFLMDDARALESVEIQAPRVELSPASPGAGAEPGPTAHVILRNLRVSEGRLRYTDAALGGDVVLGAIEASGGIGSGPLTVRASAVWERAKPTPAVSLAAILEIGPSLDVRIRSLEASTTRSKLRARGSLARAGVLAPDLEVEGDLDLSEAASVAEVLDPGGKLRGTGRVRGALVEARAHFSDLDLARLSRGARAANGISGTASGDILVRGDLAKSLAAEASFESQWAVPDQSLSLSGTANGPIDVASRSMDLRFTLALDGAPASPADAALRLEGLHLEAVGRATGAVPPAIEGSLTGSLALLTHGGRQEVPLTARFQGRGAEGTADLKAQLFGGEIGARAALSGEVFRELHLEGHGLDLASLLPDVAGRVAFGFDAQGPLPRLTGAGHLEAEALAWRDATIGSAALELAVKGGACDLSLEARDLQARASAHLPASRREPLSAAVTLTETPLGRLGQRVPAGARDRTLSGTANFSLPLEGPRRLNLDALSLETRGALLTASGHLGMEEADPLELEARLRTSLGELPLPEGWSVAGEVNADVAFSGSRVRPRAAGSVQGSALAIEGPGLPRVTADALRIDVSDAGLVLAPMHASVADGSLTVSGRMPLQGLLSSDHERHGSPAEVHLEWTGLKAQALLAGLRPEQPSMLIASLSGRADLTGDFDAFGSLRGTAALDGGPLTIQDATMDLAPATLVLERGRLSTESFTARTERGVFTLAGAMDFSHRALDLSGRGGLDLRALSPLLGAASLGGTADVDVRIAGSFDAPRGSGTVTVRDGSIRAREIPEALTDLSARIVLDGDKARIEEAGAILGGGDVRASGEARLARGSLDEVSIVLTGRGLALRYPAGLRSRLDADLSFSGRPGAFKVSGAVRTLRGVYDLDEAFRESGPLGPAEPSPFLRSIGLDVHVGIESPVTIREKLASMDIEGNLQMRGDLETPAPFGRLEIRRGGKIYILSRDFTVDTGRLSYEGNWNPLVSLRAKKRIRDLDDLTEYDVVLAAEGPLDTVRPTLRAPGLSEGQTASLVATGRRAGATTNLGVHVAGEQAASLLVGHVSQSIGLDEVAVQPELLARETEPGARFTFGKQLSSAVSLIYSVGLSGPEQRFIQLEARARHDLSLKGERTDDGLYTVAAGQRLRFGGPKRPLGAKGDDRVRLTGVRLEGTLPLPEKEMRGALRAKTGKRLSAWEVQEDADRLRALFVEERFLEVQVGARLDEGEAIFLVRAGPRFAWTVEGMTDPPDLGDAVRSALFEEEALENGRRLLLDTLASRGHLRAAVEARSVPSNGERTLRFVAAPGPRLSADVSFPGAALLPRSRLLKAAGGAAAILRSPEDACRAIAAAYREKQHLAAACGPVDVQEAGAGHLRIVVPVREGAAARIASVRFEGASRSTVDLARVAALPPEAPFATETLAAAVERLRVDYFAAGYPAVRVSADTKARGEDVDVVFRVVEGDRATIGSVEIRGLGRTRESVVRRRVSLSPGDPLDPRRLAQVERRLVELGIFSQVVVSASDGNPATVTIELTEDARFATAYDVRVTDSKTTTQAVATQLDGELRNVAGIGLRAGARYRLGTDLREARGSLFLPTLGRGSLTASLFHTEEDFEATDIFTGEPFINVETERGLQVQEALPLGNRLEALVGYRFKRVSSTAFPDPIDIAALDLSLLRDTRDNPIDSRRGRFVSATFEISPGGLGSDFTFTKGFFQAFLNKPLGASWSWAQGFRLGLAHAYGGQQLIPSERFKAGGANSIRGFELDSVGPVDLLGEPKGGNAVVIVNEELRYRHPSGLGAALFYDAGNVFESISEMSLRLRHALGAGVRWNSPIGLLRLDLGVPLSPLEDESPYQIHFSLGQSF